MKQNLKWKIPYTVFKRQILCCSSCKNHKLKVKLWQVGAPERKKGAFFVYTIYFVYCLLFIVLSRCIVYWIHFQNTHIFIYQKTLYTSYTCLIVLKIVKCHQCILKNKYTSTSYQKALFHIDYQPISINQNNMFSNIFYIYHKMWGDLDLFLVYFMVS